MSNYSFPEITAQQIASFLAEAGIVTINPEEIERPTAEFVRSVYDSVIFHLDTLGYDDGEQVDFEALNCLDNPEYFVESNQLMNLHRKVKSMLGFLRIEFTLKDLLRPDRARTKGILSAIVNFLMYRADKLSILEPIANSCNTERRAELESRISKLKKEIEEHEAAREQELPFVQEIEAEIRGLKQTIQERNKEQMSLKTHFKKIKEGIDVINDKISQVDFELLGNAQKSSTLRASIVQSPAKLQRAVEEKKAKRTEVKNAERSAMLSVQSKTQTLEVYSKACEKIRKHVAKLHNLQEQLAAAKTVEKEVKTLKSKLSDDDISILSFDAQIDDLHDKVKQAEDLVKAMEKERDLRISEHSQKLSAVISKEHLKLQDLEKREKNIQDTVLKADSYISKTASIREAGKQNMQELHYKMKEIIDAERSYSAQLESILEKMKAEAEKGALMESTRLPQEATN
ncbi:kinetochore protein NUF2 homolog [Wolffia australiana]